MRTTTLLMITALLAAAPACERRSERCPSNEPSDCPPASKISCGGFAGLPCPEGMTCVDDRTDDCDPARGGADCIGVCVARQSCDYEADPHKNYIGRSSDECAVIRFVCAEGWAYFADDCGCGCEVAGT